jgi:hypothetical protein
VEKRSGFTFPSEEQMTQGSTTRQILHFRLKLLPHNKFSNL